MLDLDSLQRALIADKLSDIANIAVGGMVFGQFLSDRGFSVAVAATGVGLWGLLLACSVVLAGRSRL